MTDDGCDAMVAQLINMKSRSEEVRRLEERLCQTDAHVDSDCEQENEEEENDENNDEDDEDEWYEDDETDSPGNITEENIPYYPYYPYYT